jgi:hypothetical protein
MIWRARKAGRKVQKLDERVKEISKDKNFQKEIEKALDAALANPVYVTGTGVNFYESNSQRSCRNGNARYVVRNSSTEELLNITFIRNTSTGPKRSQFQKFQSKRIRKKQF